MKQAEFVAFVQNVIMNFVVDIFAECSFRRGADHQANCAIVSKQSLMSKIYTQSHFVHMLQTLPVSSNYEVLIMFTREFGIHPLVRDKSTLHMIYFLR